MIMTPGPWLYRGSYASFGYFVVCDKNDRRIAAVHDLNEANTKLIAAAPDLLAALQQAVTSMQDSGYANSHIAVRAARAAISKATNTQPTQDTSP